MKMVAFQVTEGGSWLKDLHDDLIHYEWKDGYCMVKQTGGKYFKPASVLFEGNVIFDNIIAAGLKAEDVSAIFVNWPSGLGQTTVSQAPCRNPSQSDT